MAQICYRVGQIFMGLALSLGSWECAFAASLSLVPVRISLTAKTPISAITVRNEGDEATVVQLEVSNWSQVDGKDLYVDTAEILATPPIFTVPAGGMQLVRIGLRRAADADRELAYRVFMQEVPPPQTPEFRGLHVALRFGVPIFVAPTSVKTKGGAASPLPTLQWHLRAPIGSGSLMLTANNTGAAHVQITHFMLTASGNQKPLLERNTAQYVLSGQHAEWQMALKAPPGAGTTLHLAAASDAGLIATDLVVEAP